MQLLATHGRLNFFAGLGVAADVGIDTNRVHYKGLTLTGTTGSSNADYAKALQLVGDGRVDLSGLLTETFSIDDIAEAFDYAASGAGMKAVVSPVRGSTAFSTDSLGDSGHQRMRALQSGTIERAQSERDRYVMAMDAGTTGIRAILFDSPAPWSPRPARSSRRSTRNPGWVEHNPLDIWNTQITVAKKVLDTAGVSADEIAAIGITNQRETTIVWDRHTGHPVMNAIVWQDRRTAGFCDELKARG